MTSTIIELPVTHKGTVESSPVDSLIALSDGRFILTHCPYLEIWNPQTHKLDYTIKNVMYENGPLGVFIECPLYNQILCAEGKGYIDVYNNLNQVWLFSRKPHTSTITDIINVGPGIFASCSDDKTIKVWKQNPFKVLHTLEEYAYKLLLLPDGRIASLSLNKTLRIWNLHTNKCDLVIDKGIDKYNLELSVVKMDAGYAIGMGGAFTFKVWDSLTGKLICPIRQTNNFPFAISYKPNKVITNNNTAIKVYDIKEGESYEVKIHEDEIVAAMLLDENTLLTASKDTTLKITDLKSNTVIRTFEGHTSQVRYFTRLSDGRIASYEMNGKIIIWTL